MPKQWNILGETSEVKLARLCYYIGNTIGKV